MRTTIDIPDHLMKRAKRCAAQRKTTLRALMLDALERSLSEKPVAFELRDASAGSGSGTVDSASINRAIDELWTVDRDFSRFPGLRHRNPLAHR